MTSTTRAGSDGPNGRLAPKPPVDRIPDQAGDVGACDEQHETHGGEKDHERCLDVSEQVLEKIAAALRLDSDERDYLFMLTQHRLPAPVPGDSHYFDVSETLCRMIDSLGTPAIVMTERWDVLYWNSLVTAAIRDYGSYDPDKRNLLRILFTTEAGRLSEEDFEAMAHRVIARFHVDFSQSANPDEFEELVDELSEASSVFRKLWDDPELATRSVGVHTVKHKTHGALKFEHSSYVPEGRPHLRVIVYAPYDEHCAAVIAEEARKTSAA